MLRTGRISLLLDRPSLNNSRDGVSENLDWNLFTRLWIVVNTLTLPGRSLMFAVEFQISREFLTTSSS